MNHFFEIAYATVSNRICFFTGTGFSKAVTENQAPSWQKLLEMLCDLCEEPEEIKEALFPTGKDMPLSLEESAQAIEIELLKNDKQIHEETAKIIKGISLSGDNTEIIKFINNHPYRAITTNYDKLLEKLTGEEEEYHSLTPGLPIPRYNARAKIYHVHGSIDAPESMVITSDNYFKFINNESYFSRKLSTTLHENTVVILGYSLGDTNLKAIINDYRMFSKSHTIGSNIFLISRSKVNNKLKDFYSHCYGIRVIDNIEIQDFFKQLNESLPEAEKCVKASLKKIREVIYEDQSFTKDFLIREDAFFEVIASISAIGLSINDHRVVKALAEIIKSKTELTENYNAWDQYEHLARWLIYLATILEIQNTSLEEVFLSSTLRSMTTMRKVGHIGYSWHAYNSWDSRWNNITASNRALIKKNIIKNTTWGDALSIVKRG